MSQPGYKNFNALSEVTDFDFSEYIEDGKLDVKKALESYISFITNALRMPRFVAHDNGGNCQHCEAVDDLLETIYDGIQRTIGEFPLDAEERPPVEQEGGRG